MYQPYPGTPQMPDSQPRPIPGTVRQAVRAMYGGAVVSLIYLISSVATQGSTKTAIEKRFPNLTASQVTTQQHVLLIAGVASGLIAIAAWILLARACQAGKNWARMTGTVLFGLATLDAVGGLINPVVVQVKILAFVIWLFGLIAVIRLWQAASTAFFKAPRHDRGPRAHLEGLAPGNQVTVGLVGGRPVHDRGQHRDICDPLLGGRERVLGQHREVGQLARLERADLVLPVHRGGGVRGVQGERVPGRELLAGPEYLAAGGAAAHGVAQPEEWRGADDRGVGRAGHCQTRPPPGPERVELVAAAGERRGEPVPQDGQEAGLAHDHDAEFRGPGGERRVHRPGVLDPVPPRVPSRACGVAGAGRPRACQHGRVCVQHGLDGPVALSVHGDLQPAGVELTDHRSQLVPGEEQDA